MYRTQYPYTSLHDSHPIIIPVHYSCEPPCLDITTTYYGYSIIITTVIRTYDKVKPNELTVKEGQEVRVMDATAYIQVSSIASDKLMQACWPQSRITYVRMQ